MPSFEEREERQRRLLPLKDKLDELITRAREALNEGKLDEARKLKDQAWEVRAKIDEVTEKLDRKYGTDFAQKSAQRSRQQLDDLEDELDDLAHHGEQRTSPFLMSPGQDIEPGKILMLSQEQRMADVVRRQSESDYTRLSLGRYVKGIVTGDWSGAEDERRAMAEGTLAGGGYLVPTPLSAQVIDRARNLAQVMKAGAVTVPMDSETLTVARVVEDPTVAWKVENAPITASDMTFEPVKFQAKTLVGMAKLSVELFEDAANIDQVVENALSQAIALELDRAALRGSGVDPEPRGVRNVSGVQFIDLGDNGGQIDFGKFSEAVQKIQEANGPDASSLAAIYAPRTAGTLDRLTDSTGQPLQPPASFANLRKLVTNQVPVNLTKGTAANASEAYVGDFKQLWIGMRKNLTIEVSRQAGDAFGNLQVWIRIYARYDVQLAQPKHFVVIDGIIP